MFHKWSIAWRLSVSVLLASVLILSAVIGYGYIIARQILEQELEAKARQMARATTGRIELVEIAARKIVDGKYSTDAPGIKSLEDMLAVANELVERERRR